MRLPIIERGQSRRQRFLMGVVKALAGEVPGPMMVMSHRQPFFGRHFSRLLQQVMRKGVRWTHAETELFATWVSAQNECAY